jgi:hypothetical protein
MGFFGVGGSSVATPVLALLGVPPLIALTAPLPATIPSAALSSVPYARAGQVRPRAAGWTMLGAIPATVVGALLSRVVGGPVLLILSGVVLAALGLRLILVQLPATSAGSARRQNRLLLVAASAGVGLFTGLLANGGGFLLVPLYLLVFGLTIRESIGTSLVVVIALATPTLATHWALGHVDWKLSLWFAIGMLPASYIAAHFSQRTQTPTLIRAFAWFLLVFGSAFTLYRLLG